MMKNFGYTLTMGAALLYFVHEGVAASTAVGYAFLIMMYPRQASNDGVAPPMLTDSPAYSIPAPWTGRRSST